MKEHISTRGKEQNVRTFCRGPGKPCYTLCHYHTPFRLTSPWPPQESSASACLPYLMLCVISVYLISVSSERKRLFELVCLAIAPELFGLNQRKCGQAEGKRRASLQGSLGGPAVPSIFL